MPIKDFYGFSRTVINKIYENENKLDPDFLSENNARETKTKHEKMKKKITLAKKRNNEKNDENFFSGNLNELSPFSNKKKETSPAIVVNLNMPKLYKLISQFYIVKKFINLLLDSTVYRRAKKLTRKHYDIIRDECFFIEGNNKYIFSEEEEKSNKTKNASAGFRMINIPSFHPNRSGFHLIFKAFFEYLILFIT